MEKIKYLLLIFLLAIVPVTVFISQQKQQTEQHAAANTPVVYFGAFTDNDFWNFSSVPAFEADAGKALAIVMDYQDWDFGLNDGASNFTPSWMNQVRSHGSIPLITWEPQDYHYGVNQPTYQLKNMYNGTDDAYFTKWAQDAKNWGYPFFLRFAHEMNGNWYPWSEQVNGNQQGDFVKAWRHIHDIFVANGATNVTWVWSPNVEYSYTAPLAPLYPGDQYVDWVGMDGYNWGTSQPGFGGFQTFSQVFNQTYTDLKRLAPTKPIMVAEGSSAEEGGSKAQWITDMLQTQLPNNFPSIKAFIWFNQKKERDWRIESSSTAQQAFAHAVASSYYASNQFGNLNTSPIIPLSSGIPNPTAGNTPTISLTVFPTPTTIPQSTATPIIGVSPSLTLNPSPANFILSIMLHGLGKGGDNANPNGGGNINPKHTQKSITIFRVNSNTEPITKQQGTLNYNAAIGNFTGTIGMGSLAAGNYLITVTVPGYLSKQLPGIQTVTAEQTNVLPSVSLTTGDINNDNQLDILDYNILIGCFGIKSNSSNCLHQTESDINDDGNVDGIDYNLFLRELSVQKGQ